MKSTNYTPKQRYISSTVSLSVGGIVFLSFLCVGISAFFNKLSPLNYFEFQGIVSKEPHFSGGKSANIEFTVKSVPGFTFEIDPVTRNVTKQKKLFREVKIGDTLSITIGRNDYCLKVKRNCRSNFLDRNINYRWISVAALSGQGNEYISLEEYEAQQHEQSVSVMLFCAVILTAILSIFLYERRRYRKSRTQL